MGITSGSEATLAGFTEEKKVSARKKVSFMSQDWCLCLLQG